MVLCYFSDYPYPSNIDPLDDRGIAASMISINKVLKYLFLSVGTICKYFYIG